MAEEIERIYVIPLKKTGFNSARAAPTAIKRVKNYLTRHMKVEEKDIWIDDSLNKALWSRGKYTMENKIRVKAVKFDDGVVEAYLPELEFKKSRRELLKEEREKKEPILRKEEMAPEEAEGETGAEDYEIAPTADGEVKIKKKKAEKTKKEKEEKKTEKKSAKKEEKETKKEPAKKAKKTSSKKETKTSSSKTAPKKKKNK
jgi:large subunit ribosomal protein L31e